MSILEIILYICLGLATTTYVTITIIKWLKHKKKKINRGGMRYGNDPMKKNEDEEEDYEE